MSTIRLEDPEKRAEYMLEQIRIYLKIHENRSHSTEYKDISIIFSSLLNVMNESNYLKLCNELVSVRKRINATNPYSNRYWNEYLKFMHWKLTGRF